MDHRWDRQLEQERQARAERERFGGRRIEDDPDVEQRDRELERLRGAQKSPWDVGAEHWNQRDLYTRNARIDDAGYALGPRVHPDIGSYAYHRDRLFPEDAGEPRLLYEREAWPWENYGFVPPERRGRHTHGLWDRMRARVRDAFGKGPKAWRSDARILEDVSEALSEHGDIDARSIEVSVKEGEVTLDGTVPDRRTKRLAEDVTARCRGVRDVHNRLRVHDDDDRMLLAVPRVAF